MNNECCCSEYCREYEASASTKYCTKIRCIVLHYTVLHYATLLYTALHCTALHYTTLHCSALRRREGRGRKGEIALEEAFDDNPEQQKKMKIRLVFGRPRLEEGHPTQCDRIFDMSLEDHGLKRATLLSAIVYLTCLWKTTA